MVHEVLAVRGLVVSLGGRRAIDGLDLSVPAGSVYALLGGNGAGKTTTLNVLLGFVVPMAGSVQVDGLDPIRDAAAARLRLAYLPENVALYPYLSGIENLRYFCALGGVALADAAARALLDQAGLQGSAHAARVATYSKGMRQKVGLAIAHAKHAKAMLLDEPTSGLDPGAANDFAQRVRAAADTGMAVLMATHDLFNAKQVADRIGIMKEGQLVAEFDTHTVSHDDLERAYLAYTRAAPLESDA
jgi:ABC-2 type transport system ATP-binding protein